MAAYTLFEVVCLEVKLKSSNASNALESIANKTQKGVDIFPFPGYARNAIERWLEPTLKYIASVNPQKTSYQDTLRQMRYVRSCVRICNVVRNL